MMLHVKVISTTSHSKPNKRLQKILKYSSGEKKKGRSPRLFWSFYNTFIHCFLSIVCSSDGQLVTLDEDRKIMQREWLPGGKFEMGPIAKKRVQV